MSLLKVLKSIKKTVFFYFIVILNNYFMVNNLIFLILNVDMKCHLIIQIIYYKI